MTGKRKTRFGIIGFGLFAEKAIAPAIQKSDNAELVALQKRSRAAAEAKSREIDIPLAFGSAEELVAHPDVDAVFIVSANSAHAPETLAAARAGKHVLVEKPMALNTGQAEEMIRVCRSAGVKLMVGHMIRFSPLAMRIRDIIRSGELGAIGFARADFVYDARLSHRTWLVDRTVAGGGPVYDIGVHCLDTLRFVLDDEVVSVKSECEPWPTGSRTESLAHIQLRFSRGVVGSIFCSFTSPIRKTELEVIGTDGVLSVSHFTIGDTTLRLTVERGHEDQPADSRIEEIAVPNLYIKEITHFADCIVNNREPVSPGENGLINQRVLDQILTRPGSD
jgi:predicted dehydrogenase